MPRNKKEKQKGFTLIELLIVIAIIGLLSSTVLASLSNARIKARTAKRLSDMKQIQTGLELYYSDNGAYPMAMSWRSQCATWGAYASSNVIPGLVPNYLGSFPADPGMNAAASTSCYLYLSDGVDYKILDYIVSDLSSTDYGKYPTFMDPDRDGGPNACVLDGNSSWAFAVYTKGAACW